MQPAGTKLAPNLNGPEGRQRPLRILLVHRDLGGLDREVQGLNILGYAVSADVVVTPEEYAERLGAEAYDVIVAEYPSPNWKMAQALELLRESGRQIPLIFVGDELAPETVAELITRGASDCIETDHIGHLPVSVRRALDEGRLRMERDRVEKLLKHSEARYRALIGNLTYGICRCGLDGKFLDVNQALTTMLGYESREELLCANLASAIILDPIARARLLGHDEEKNGNNPFETEWHGSQGRFLKVRLTGREVVGEHGGADSYEVIVEDVTKQRELEEQLRQQAMRDALTGLANYRQLVDVLSREIKRSNRTGREFALLLLDLNGLKEINDSYGHLVGSNALCRLADALCICSRDIDTAARFGGDEFALVMPETGEEPADLVAQRVCDGLSKDVQEPQLSVCYGVAIHPRDGGSIEGLLQTADRALYKMKAARKRDFRNA
jgi:diguanylate cyclase (GGDEF)-like protein/PAS domain S-box-containing protein